MTSTHGDYTHNTFVIANKSLAKITRGGGACEHIQVFLELLMDTCLLTNLLWTEYILLSELVNIEL